MVGPNRPIFRYTSVSGGENAGIRQIQGEFGGLTTKVSQRSQRFFKVRHTNDRHVASMLGGSVDQISGNNEQVSAFVQCGRSFLPHPTDVSYRSTGSDRAGHGDSIPTS